MKKIINRGKPWYTVLYYLFKIVLPTPLPDFKIFTAQCMHRWELSHHHAAGFCYMLTCSYFVCHFCHVRLCVANGISPANLVHDDNGQLTYLLTFSIIMGPNHLLFDDYVFVRPHFLSCHHYRAQFKNGQRAALLPPFSSQ